MSRRLAVFLVGVSLGLYAPPALTAEEAPIFFERELESAVYAINPDGTGLRKVAEGYRPNPSPDGQFVLVQHGGNLERIGVDGSLMSLGAYATLPEWSPDGQRIVFQRYGGVYVMNYDGSGERVVTEDGAAPHWWSSDLRWVYFNRTRPESIDATDLYRANIETGVVERVLELTYIQPVRYPFSPDGTRLLVSSCGDGSFCVQVLVLAIGELITIGPAGDRNGAQRPAWSPDGRQVAFEVFDGMGGLFLADAAGAWVRELVPGRGEAAPGAAAWSPQGDRIAFQVRDWMGSNKTKVWLINTDGTGMRELAEGNNPLWVMPGVQSVVGANVEALSWGKAKRLGGR